VNSIRTCHTFKATGVAGSEKHLLTLLLDLDGTKHQITCDGKEKNEQERIRYRPSRGHID
jgi:hypothetical protein